MPRYTSQRQCGSVKRKVHGGRSETSTVTRRQQRRALRRSRERDSTRFNHYLQGGGAPTICLAVHYQHEEFAYTK